MECIAFIRSGMFRGGSEIGARFITGPGPVPDVTVSIEGFMRFEAASPDSPSAEILRNRIESQTGSYHRLMERHDISCETFNEKRTAKTRESSR